MIRDVDQLVDKAMEQLEGEVSMRGFVKAMGLDVDLLSEVDLAQIEMSLSRYRTDVYHSKTFPLLSVPRKSD
jgi:hypothetical protein